MNKYTFEAFTGKGEYFGNVTVMETTWHKMEAAKAAGAVIVVNKNWRYTGNARFQRIEKLAQTNTKTDGVPKQIVWACYGDNGNLTKGSGPLATLHARKTAKMAQENGGLLRGRLTRTDNIITINEQQRGRA